MALLNGNPEESKGAIIGGIIYMVLVWFVFWEVIQPALANLSSIFIYESEVMGRYPDGPVIALLFAIILLGLFSYYLLLMLLYEGVDEFTKTIFALYGFVIVLTIGTTRNIILPKLGIDRWDGWEYDPMRDKSQDND